MDQARTETAGSYAAMILLAWLGGTIGRSLGDIQDAVPRAVVVGAVVLLLL